MNYGTQNPITRTTFNSQELVTSHPPRFHNANKQALNEYVSPIGCIHRGDLTVSRWRAMELPESLPEFRSSLEPRAGYYGYEPTPQSSMVEWYVNFADRYLFKYYATGLFAQDEIQVAEHPALASVREALTHTGGSVLTVEDSVPTPILIKGVERRCAVATNIDAAAGRPNGLYGNRFTSASAKTVIRSATLIDPPTISNIIAMEAPSYGSRVYSNEDIGFVLTTAFTGFSAARRESSAEADVVVHTGFWGCGAYGGNRVMMAMLQLLAAHLSGLTRFVFHTSDAPGSAALETAAQLLKEDMEPSSAAATPDGPTIAEIVSRIQKRGLKWGTSDGN